jgi:hypothetical protein
MSENEDIIIIIVIIINKICGKEFLVKLLSDLFSLNPTVKLCLTRQLRIFNSVCNVVYGIFPATVVMRLCAVLLKVISLRYNHLSNTNMRDTFSL